MQPRTLQEILDANDEIELSEFSPDPEAGNGDGPPPFPPAPAPVRVEVAPPVPAPPAMEPKAQERPRRRPKKWAAPTGGSNGHGEACDLSKVFVTIPQAAALFHMHPGSVWRLVCEGRLPAVKLGRVLIPAEAVTAFTEARKLKPRQWARRQKEPPGAA